MNNYNQGYGNGNGFGGMPNQQQQQHQQQGYPSQASPIMANGNVPLPQADAGLSGAVQNRRRWDDEVRWFDFPDRIMVTIRLFGPVFVTYNHWLKTRQGKRFPLCCPAYDQTTQNFVAGKCPICDEFNIPSIIASAKNLNPNFNEEYDPNLKELKQVKARISGLTHVIIRNAANVGDPSLATRPWHPIRLGPAVFFNLLRLKNMNVCNINGKQYQADLADPYWGRDIHVYYNSQEKNPQMKYMITLGDHTPLTELEKTYVKEVYNWSNLVEYSNFEDSKQSLQVNGYYQLLTALTSATPVYGQENTQYAQYDTLLKPPTPPAYANPQQQQQQYGMPEQHSYPQPQNMGYNNPYQQPMPNMPQQFQAPQMPQNQSQGYGPAMGYSNHPQQPSQPSQMYAQPPMAMAPNMNGLTQVETPMQTPIPTNVAPPMGYNNTIPTQEGEIEIPFDQAGRTFPLKGRSVSKEDFEEAIKSFAGTISRGQPVQQAKSGDLAGVLVPNCFGDYLGDTNCIKCPIRPSCVHS